MSLASRLMTMRTARISPQSGLGQHHLLWIDCLQKVADGKIMRLMGLMPPGSAKSTYSSVVFPTYFMGRFPGEPVIVASYGSILPKKFGRRARSIVKQPQYKRIFDTELSMESAAADEWALTNGSEFMGAGFLAGVTGNRAKGLIWDDPIKGREQADSITIRDKTWDAYFDDLLSRKKPGAWEIAILTRWHEDDPAGRILPEGYSGESGWIDGRDGNKWFVVCIPAEAERSDDVLNRKVGERIWPEWFGPDHFAPFKRNSRSWNSLYQQRPAPEEGDYFKKEWLKPVIKLPDRNTLRVYGGSDYAVTADGGDYTVHVVIGVDPKGQLYLLDIWRGQKDSSVWIEAFCDLVEQWKPIGWAEENGQIKSGVGPFLTRRMRERKTYVAREAFPTRGDKAIRAQSIRGRMSLEGLYYPADATWFPTLEAELLSFPAGKHDDQCVADGTMIGMADGSQKTIESVKVGDLVKTHEGPKEVEASEVTQESARVYRIRTSCGKQLVATGNHPVYVENKGFVRADALCIMDQLRLEGSCKEIHQRSKLLSTEEIGTGVTQKVDACISETILRQPRHVRDFCIDMSGKMKMDQSQISIIFIISMATQLITRRIISSAYRSASIAGSILWGLRRLRSKRSIWTGLDLKRHSGIKAIRAAPGTLSMARALGLAGLQSIRFALLAIGDIKPILSAQSFVLAGVNREALAAENQSVDFMLRTASPLFANVATGGSLRNGPITQCTAQRRAGCVIAVTELSKRVRVRNLTVKGAHTYYANGILTHNCDALGLVGQLLDKMIAGRERPRDKPKMDVWDRAFARADEGEVDSWKSY